MEMKFSFVINCYVMDFYSIAPITINCIVRMGVIVDENGSFNILSVFVYKPLIIPCAILFFYYFFIHFLKRTVTFANTI